MNTYTHIHANQVTDLKVSLTYRKKPGSEVAEYVPRFDDLAGSGATVYLSPEQMQLLKREIAKQTYAEREEL